MTPKTQKRGTFELFQSHFDQLLNQNHELVILANKIDWPRFQAAFADCYCPDNGAPGKAIRLMVGMQYLKYTFNVSDEDASAHNGWKKSSAKPSHWQFEKNICRKKT